MKTLIGQWLFILIFLCFCSCQNVKDFQLKKISSALPYDPRWETVHKPPYGLFDQEFYYLGQGAQSYVFASADQQYVLKFFKMKHLLAKWWVSFIPRFPFLRSYIFKKVHRRNDNRTALFTAYKMALEELAEETGVVFIHLNKTNSLGKKVVLKFASGKQLAVELDPLEFVVQKKAEPLRTVLSVLRAQGREAEVDRKIQAIAVLVEKRCQKGFKDCDSGVSNNYGFVGEDPIQIDVGRLCRDCHLQQSPELIYHEVERIRQKLHHVHSTHSTHTAHSSHAIHRGR